jgi:outer membrane protein TolC
LQDGFINYQALLSAEQAYQQAQINLVQAQANRFADSAALFQALGGGWWHRADLTQDHDEKN